ncbi:tumor protein p53-inducible protein 13 isoform X2 [Brachyhypopomus gauderio]|uniref:tumor protein p53-inducible protein 13 isoform X2 n=1 Tax=Brachyhypopomus gauderio TaxID=698409 RepID=UPI004042676C
MMPRRSWRRTCFGPVSSRVRSRGPVHHRYRFIIIHGGEHRSERLPDIPTKHPLQPSEHVCMDVPITYNHTVPSSGVHRPIGAKSGEYLYCPPQRWLNNLKEGAIVLLYHPCVSAAARRTLAVVANSCLPYYILTAHPQLSQQRPFAVVSWGRTLEMSHITPSGLCEWLFTLSILNHTKRTQRPNYSLYLIKAASVDRALRATAKLTVQGPGPEVLKSVRECCMDVLSAYEHTAEQSRRSRAANQDEVKRSRSPARDVSEAQKPNVTHSQPLAVTHDGNKRPTAGRVGRPAEAGTAVTEGGALLQNHVRNQEEQANLTGSPEPRADGQVHGEATGERKRRVKTDVQEPRAADGQAGTTPAGEKPPAGQRRPGQHSDEAVWAAAALGFLLVLLTLSVLHTRLYRHWRAPASLYWHEAQQDYESVADIIRRRLRMVGRRKRKPSQSRRQECPLLPDSGTDSESD